MNKDLYNMCDDLAGMLHHKRLNVSFFGDLRSDKASKEQIPLTMNLIPFYTDVSQMLLEWFEAQGKADEI